MSRKPKPSKILGKQVNILWEDAYSDDDAYVEVQYEADAEPSMKVLVEVLGFVVKDGDDGIMVARERFGDGRFRSVQFIPRGMVRKVKVLR